MAIYLILVFLCLLLSWFFIIPFSKFKQTRFIPGPPQMLIFGNALDLNISTNDLYNLFRKWMKIYYPILKVRILNLLIIHVRHPDDLEIILKSPINVDKNFGYEFFRSWLKNGILTSKRKKWQVRRKILTPAFHFKILEKYMEVMNEYGEKAIAHLKENGQETIVDIEELYGELTLKIICASAMDVNIDDEKKKASLKKYKNALQEMSKIIMYRNMRPYIKDWMLPFLPSLHNKIKRCVNELNGFTDEIINQRRKYHEDTINKYLKLLQTDTENFENIYYGEKKRLAALDLLLSAEKDGLIDHEGIIEEVSSLIFGGHDTTTMTLIFLTMALAENKEIQNQARREITEIMDRKGGKLEFPDMKDMVFVDRVIKETMRLYPVIPTIGRYMTEEIQLKKFLIPKGTDVMMHIVDVHRDPNFWTNPDEFDPNRFLPEEIKKRHPFSYVPFSAGMRNCLGQKYAMIELKCLIAQVLYNFYLEPIDCINDVGVAGDILMRPMRSVRTKFVKIDRS